MHPAPSVIAFTTLSGLGFGLLFWLGLGLPAPTGWLAFVFFLIAFGLATGGLIASTFHLGRPERAWRAFTQWQTSWLSREAWAAVVTLLVAGLYAIGLMFFDTRWGALGVAAAIGALVTVLTTSMIYTQLKTVPRWNHWTTPVLFQLFALGGGALLAGQISAALPLLAALGAMQVVAWMIGDRALGTSGTDLGTATGLGDRGTVRAFEPPHTGRNYLLDEMVYVVGRRRAAQLRLIGLVLAIGLPLLLLVLPFSHGLAALAVLSHLTGVLAIRWLFFAEAEHVVGLYYGLRGARGQG